MSEEDIMKRNGRGRERSSELKTQKGVMRISGKREMLDSIDGIGNKTSYDLRN
jgi:hypothetical protein